MPYTKDAANENQTAAQGSAILPDLAPARLTRHPLLPAVLMQVPPAVNVIEKVSQALMNI